ncbi:MAG: PAS domain S-box protein [Thermodesulfovibrionales bacterium]|nr:PAS domain S-box protein [Thermodesulfovibrionales bacterium]
MDKELRILILEDVPADAELEEHELRKAGLVFTSKVVDTREAFLKELEEFFPDLILSDYELPTFDGLAALRIAQEKCPDVPFILVTGKLGEEFAIDKLKDGATDYVLKSNLKRLVPSVKRALEEVKERAERKKAEEALRTSEAELHDNYFVQSTINLILSISLEELPLEEFLQKSLNMILSVPWISFQSIGSIFVAEDNQEVLIMKAQLNLPEPLKELCGKVPFGKCICGKAALSQQIQLIEHIDESHEICYEVMSPHGHCVVPILFGGNTLGVINIYLNEGHILNEKETEFLLSVADSLSGIIIRKRAEESLRQNELYLKTIMASIQAGVMVIDADKHKIVDVNDIASKLIGAPKEQIIGRICHEYVCPAEKGKCPITDLKQVIDNAERTLIDINEKKIPIIKTVVPLTFQNRTYLLESFIDITERKQAEQQIAIFRKFAEESSLAYGFADLNGDIFYINATLCRILGLEKPDDALGTNVAIYYPDNMKSKLLNEVLPIVKSEGGWAGDIPLQSIKGKVTPTIQNISLIRDDKGKPLYIGNIITDITERKKSEAELQERVKELEDFYHMAVGRELRMKELKEEMRELREELEKYKKQ